MARDDQLSLHQMLDYATEAHMLVADKAFTDLKYDRLLELAVIRLLEILGEAANRVSEEKQQQHVDIPWRAIIGLRNRLIHGYDSVDLRIVWHVVTNDLPPLIEQLEDVLDAEE